MWVSSLLNGLTKDASPIPSALFVGPEGPTGATGKTGKTGNISYVDTGYVAAMPNTNVELPGPLQWRMCGFEGTMYFYRLLHFRDCSTFATVSSPLSVDNKAFRVAFVQ